MSKNRRLASKASSAVIEWLVTRPPMATHLYNKKNVHDFSDRLVHEMMLSDSYRIDRYYEAIDKLVRHGDIVIDLGAGTGILSFFAAKKAEKVHAIEHASIIEIADRLAAINGFRNINFHHCNSRDFVLQGKVDIIVHEQIGGNNPLSENMIENIIDLRDRVLRPGGKILPNRFDIFLEPLQLKDDAKVPFLWEMDIHGVAFRELRGKMPRLAPIEGSISPYHYRNITPPEVQCLLCEPKPILSFDLETMGRDDLPKRVVYQNTAERDGVVDGLCIYFRAIFDDAIVLETSPLGPRTSWTMRMYRVEGMPVRKGQRVSYELGIKHARNDDTWTLNWMPDK